MMQRREFLLRLVAAAAVFTGWKWLQRFHVEHDSLAFRGWNISRSSIKPYVGVMVNYDDRTTADYMALLDHNRHFLAGHRWVGRSWIAGRAGS